MILVKDIIKEYNDKATELTNQGKGLGRVAEVNWYDYINSFDNISEELKELHEATYKLEDGKEDTLFITANPLELTIPEMINNRDAIDAHLITGFNKVKPVGVGTVANFILNLKNDNSDINIKDIIIDANDWSKKKAEFLDAELVRIIGGLPQPEAPEPTYDGVTLSWEPVEGANSYLVTWDEANPVGGASGINEYETSDPHIDLAIIMTNFGAIPGDYLVKVFAKTDEGLVSEPSTEIAFTLIEDAEKIIVVDVTSVTRDGATDTNPELSNIGKYTVTFNGDTQTVDVIAIASLESHESTSPGRGDAKWIGVIIKTNRDIAGGVEVNTPTMTPGSFAALDQSDIDDAIEQGVIGRSSFVWWLKSEDITEPKILHIKHTNDESDVYNLTLTFTDVEIEPEEPEIPIIPTYTTAIYDTFPTTWESDLTKVISDPTTEVEDGTEFTQADLNAWTTADSNFATLTRYVEVDAIGGVDADFDLINMEINNILVTSDDNPIAIIDGTDIDENNDGYAYTEDGKTYFKHAISFAQKNEEVWELIPDRIGASIKYIFKNDGEIVATGDGGTLPNITITD